MSITSVMPSNRLILRHPLLLMPSILPSIRVFSNESVICIRWPEYWSFSFSISPVLIFRTNRGGGFTHKPGQAVGHHHRRWLMPHVIVVQLLSRVQLCDPMDCSTSVLHLSPRVCSSSFKAVMPSNYLILCRPLLFLPSIFPSVGVFSNESGASRAT